MEDFAQNNYSEALVAEIRAEKAARRYVRVPLILSLLGLIFSVIYGVGGILSVISLILASVRLKKRKSEALRWAVVISGVTLALCIFYVLAIIAVTF